jgi:competence protein ComEC
MNIYTLNVGQGQFVVITGNSQAIIVDTYVPLNPSIDIVNVKAALTNILQGKNLVGLVVTGFDADHFNEIGLKIILNKYRPDWIMYPKYFKPTGNARTCFSVIEGFENVKTFTRISVLLTDNNSRFYSALSEDFTIEVFSPHAADMTSSNNCSLVCKFSEKSLSAAYLITGDTENDRWESIVRYFGAFLRSDVLDAPHHGSKNGISREAMSHISPDTVLISAGVNNQYGHPDAEAVRLFAAHANHVFQTNTGRGQSIRTEISNSGVNSFKFQP